MLTRRVFLPAMAAGLLAATRARADLAGIEAAARTEGGLTWYTAHTDHETAQQVADAFTAQYPQIKVTFIRTTAQVAYQRLLQDLKNGVAQCDVFSSTDLGHDETLEADGKFAKYVPENAKFLGAVFQGMDAGNTYFPTQAELVVPIYNTAKVKAADAPKSWTDLLDPRWRNQVSVGHPAYSGTVGTWVVAMRKLYGWEYFEKLEKNKPLIGRSVNDAVGVLNSGERIVAAGPSALSQTTAIKGNPIGLSYPTDGAVLMVSPSAVMANAPHPNAGRLFMEFLLGAPNARMSAEARYLPVRADAPVQPGVPPVSSIKVNRMTTAEIAAGIPEVIEQWRDTFGG